jgi:hypothetical protein
MRKIILMVSLLLLSSAAEAGQMRGLTLASNAPAVEQTEQSQPSTPAHQVQPPVRTEARTVTKTDTRAEQTCGTRAQSRDDDDRHNRRPVRHHESAEHKARRIAAHYGVYW